MIYKLLTEIKDAPEVVPHHQLSASSEKLAFVLFLGSGTVKFFLKILRQLTIGSYVSVRSSRYEARRKFGEHERCVRVARGVAESNSSFLSAL